MKRYADLLEVHSENAELQEKVEWLRMALEDLCARQHDYPTDLSRDPEWAAAFARARAALGNTDSAA